MTGHGVRHEELSKALSHALRHDPERYGLALDREGWVEVERLLDALRARGGRWATVDRAALEAMLATATKQRHQLDGDRIRAFYGHSIDAVVEHAPASPPERLFHGTSPSAWASIATEGLRPMTRQMVHLSADRDTAMLVGRRKGRDPVLLCVEALRAHEAGVVFHETNDAIWLAAAVPAEFVHEVTDHA